MSATFHFHLPNPRFESKTGPIEPSLSTYEANPERDAYASAKVHLPDGNDLVFFVHRPVDALTIARVFVEAARSLLTERELLAAIQTLDDDIANLGE